jgi:hypothetical protein
MRIHFALLAAIGTGSLFAQSYIPLLRPSSTWQDEYATASPGPNTSDKMCLRFSLEGDTVIGDMGYLILHVTGRYEHQNSIETELSYTAWYDGVSAFLREDTVSRKVYIRRFALSPEEMLYDFSADTGSYPPNYRYPYSQTIISVDTVWLADGPHRRMNFNEFHAIIEGIGSTMGLMPSPLFGEINYLKKLICHEVEASVDYETNSTYCACSPNVGIQTYTDSDIDIGPSPTTGTCYVRGAPTNAPFKVLSIDGRLVQTGNCTMNGSATLDLGLAPIGIYIIEVWTGTLPHRFKVMKE